MKLLSIDVGIKNLAYCYLDTEENITRILRWDVINLCGTEPLCTSCASKASLITPDGTVFFCKKHAKKSIYMLPRAELQSKVVNKLPKEELFQMAVDLALPEVAIPEVTDSNTKQGNTKPSNTKPSNIKQGNTKQLAAQINLHIKQNMLLEHKPQAANDLNLIQIGVAMLAALDKEILPILTEVDEIIIENQISPLAMRMKSLQGMLTQYFIMRGNTAIRFVSSANKLKGIAIEKVGDKTTYAERKKAGITHTLTALQESNAAWLPVFSTHKKQDDLADAFLQGVAYLKR
jgi:hypothetical protein